MWAVVFVIPSVVSTNHTLLVNHASVVSPDPLSLVGTLPEDASTKSKTKPSPQSKDSAQSTLKSFFATLTTPLRQSSLSPKTQSEKDPTTSDLFSQVGQQGGITGQLWI